MFHLKRRCLYIALASLLTLMSLILVPVCLSDNNDPKEKNGDYKNFADGILSDKAVFEHVKNFSSLGSRVSGYPGCEAAAKYIADYFNETLGLRTIIQTYQIVIPLDEGSYVEVLNPYHRNFSAYAFWPNYVLSSATPREGMVGKLIYVGRGDWRDLDGKDIDGSILLMDLDSGQNWINGINMGAEAVIFIESESHRYEFLQKISRNPIYVPRLYVSREDGEALKRLAKDGALVRIHSRMHYKVVNAENVIGILEGSSPGDVVIFSSHYDSWSAVPRIAPGADESSGVAALLELARYYTSYYRSSETPPRNTIWFVAFSGHWQGLAGSREFTEEFFFSPEVQRDLVKIWAQINLDFSSDSYQITPLYVGHLYASGVNEETQSRYIWTRNLISELRSRLPEDAVFWEGLRQLNWWGTEFEPYLLDSEPAALSGSLAFSLMTSYSQRLWWGTPFDTVERVDLENLMRQLNTSLKIVDEFVNRIEFGMDWGSIKPTRLRLYALGGSASYITLMGKVLTFNVTTGWYSPVPNALVVINIKPFGGYHYIFSNIYAFSDNDGEFIVHGMPSGQILGTTSPLQRPSRSIIMSAWVLDNETGEIICAPDMGIYGARTFTPVVYPLSHPFNATIVVFKCASLEIYDLFEPSTGRRGLIPDPARVGSLYYFAGQNSLLPYDFDAFAEPTFFGFYHDPSEPVGVVFVQPRLKTLVLYRRGILTSKNVGILANTSAINPEGSGYVLQKAGDRFKVKLSAYEFAKDMYMISSARHNTLSSHFVSSLSYGESMNKTYESITLAWEMVQNKTYSKAYELSLKAWAWSLNAYGLHTMPIIYDLSGTTALFFILLVPFVLFMERLTIFREGKLRLFFSALIGGITLTVFYVIHPALSILSNSALALAGIVVLFLTTFVLYVFMNKTSQIISDEAQKRLGTHRLGTSTLASIELFSSIAVKMMRRHKLRTVLTLVTLVSSTVGLVSFTSSSNYLAVLIGSRPLEAAYEGLLIKQMYGAPPQQALDTYSISLIGGVVGDRGIISPRVSLYPQSIYGKRAPTTEIRAKNGTYEVNAIMGVTSFESEMLFERQGAFLGKSRAFMEGDYYACILTETQAGVLGVGVGDLVKWNEMELIVVGIISPQMLKDDLDGRSIAPNSPQTITQYNPQIQTRIPLPIGWDFMLIVPSRLALDLGGYVCSIAVYLKGTTDWMTADLIAQELAKILDAQVYINWKGSAKSYSRLVMWALLGWEAIIALFVIAAANMLTTLIATSKERERDLRIYSFTGLSPMGSMFIILVESAIYATIAVTLGYVVGAALNIAMYQVGILPSLYVLNFSSVAVALALVGIILVVFAASIYPIVKTARMVAPSLERKWRLPSKPKGDSWEIPVPMALESRSEADGILEYLYEYFAGEGRETTYFSVVSLQGPLHDQGTLGLVASLAPREAHVTQDVKINIVELSGKKYGFSIYIKRLTGTYSTWRTSNYHFIDSVRKQLLLWRSLNEERREHYIELAQTPKS